MKADLVPIRSSEYGLNCTPICSHMYSSVIALAVPWVQREPPFGDSQSFEPS